MVVLTDLMFSEDTMHYILQFLKGLQLQHLFVSETKDICM